MIASLGGDVKPSASLTKLVGDVKEPISLFEKSRGEMMNGLIAAACHRRLYKLTSDLTPRLS